MTIHSSILAWRSPWTEGPGWLQSIGSQRAGHDSETEHMHAYFLSSPQLGIAVQVKADLVTMCLSVYIVRDLPQWPKKC